MSERVELLDGRVTLYRGDCREILPTIGKVDAVVTDPPYGMKFRSNYRTVKHDAIANDAEEWPLQLSVSIRWRIRDMCSAGGMTCPAFPSRRAWLHGSKTIGRWATLNTSTPVRLKSRCSILARSITSQPGDRPT